MSAPSIYDMDIGTDPDDTCVAVMVARDPARFGPVLMITNDETKSGGRARVLRQIVSEMGVDLPVARGLEGVRRRQEVLVETAGLLCDPPGSAGVGPQAHQALTGPVDGIVSLIEVLDKHGQQGRVQYFSLGALTNLATALDRHPEFASRVHLIQMGPALAGLYRASRPQYNLRLDPGSFARVLRQVPCPTLLLSHVSWATYGPKGRQQLGVYVGDPLYQALARSQDPGHRHYASHLAAWTHSGKPCSIMHDPLTVLGHFQEHLIDFIETEVVLSEDGFLYLADGAQHDLSEFAGSRPFAPGRPRNAVASVPFRARLSLSADYNAARAAIAAALFGPRGPELAIAWRDHNQQLAG